MELNINSKWRIAFDLNTFYYEGEIVQSLVVSYGELDYVKEDEYYEGEFDYREGGIYDDFDVFPKQELEEASDELWDGHGRKENVEEEFFDTKEECVLRFDELKNKKKELIEKYLN